VKLLGRKDALAVGRAADRAVDELAAFCEDHAIDAHVRRDGWVWGAACAAHVGAWEGAMRACESLGEAPFRPLARAELRERTGSDAFVAGVIEPRAASVHPAALVRGLRRVALERGVRIYEHSAVTSLERGRPPAVSTAGGALVAEKVVIAMNGWAVGLRELRRALAVISSDVIATASRPERLEAIGLRGGQCITDSQLMVDYLRTTRDGRLVFGKGGWSIALGARIGPSFDRNLRRRDDVLSDLRRLYPGLADLPIELDWSGPVDRSTTGLPLLGRLGERDHLLYGVGWSGNGVAPTLLGGRILASLALGRDDEWARHPLVGLQTGMFPAEPVRYVGAHLVRATVKRKERAELGGRAVGRLTRRVAAFAPAGIEDQ
jgi:glycine/D-amino acid oxidase-like deaminating enzyme